MSTAECLQSPNTTEPLSPTHSSHSNHYCRRHVNTNNNNSMSTQDSDLTTLAATGNLSVLEERLNSHNNSSSNRHAVLQVDPDQPQSGTGLRPLHFAASRGYLNIVTCLIEKAGATVDATDQEGETALLKAAYAGHMSIVEYLVNKAHANTTHQDKDGWSVLHNACSSGHLPMVQFLVQHQVPVNLTSRIGNTPLINAASKGDVAIVDYLLKETNADPLLSNKFGETAYDAAAAIGHVYLCELLEVAERSCWVDPTIRGGRRDGPYDSLSIHVTVPVLIHENQRSIHHTTPASLLLKRNNGKSITFSPTALTKNDRRKAWSMYPSGEPTTKSHVQLPPLDRTHHAWFWWTDWTIDMSHPNTDAEGWQYGKQFDDQEEEAWTSIYPTKGTGWVRRRRWMRIMKRRVDHQMSTTFHAQPYQEQQQETLIQQQGQQDHLSLVQQQAAGSSSSSNPSSSSRSSSTPGNHHHHPHGTVSMSLTKAQSVFAGCTTTTTHVPTTTTTAVETNINTNTAADIEPSSSRQSSFDWTRSARSSVASSHSRPTFVWEPNEQAPDCRRCGKWFNLIVRRHHCRRCGLVVCDKCSNRVMLLPFSHIVVDPTVPLEQHYLVSLQPQRVCDGCFEELSRPPPPNTIHGSRAESIHSTMSHPSSLMMRRSPSAQSIMMECPVCGKNLDAYGGTNEQELHVQTCLNANTPAAALSGIRYVVYKLPSNSALMGQECVICLEEFVEGNTMARLNCFCTFHHGCIHSWFAKGKECPIHSQ